MNCDLRRILKGRNQTLVQLARTSGVDASTLCRAQNGDQLGPKRRAKIARALRLPVDAIWPDAGEVRP